MVSKRLANGVCSRYDYVWLWLTKSISFSPLVLYGRGVATRSDPAELAITVASLGCDA